MQYALEGISNAKTFFQENAGLDPVDYSVVFSKIPIKEGMTSLRVGTYYKPFHHLRALFKNNSALPLFKKTRKTESNGILYNDLPVIVINTDNLERLPVNVRGTGAHEYTHIIQALALEVQSMPDLLFACRQVFEGFASFVGYVANQQNIKKNTVSDLLSTWKTDDITAVRRIVSYMQGYSEREYERCFKQAPSEFVKTMIVAPMFFPEEYFKNNAHAIMEVFDRLKSNLDCSRSDLEVVESAILMRHPFTTALKADLKAISPFDLSHVDSFRGRELQEFYQDNEEHIEDVLSKLGITSAKHFR